MPVSDDEITWAYRILLDREPESLHAVATQRVLTDRRALRDSILNSEEFRARAGAIFGAEEDVVRVGRFLLEGPSQIEIECTADELARMLAQISREWTGFGERDAHWSVITKAEFTAPSIGDHEDAFYALGTVDIGWVTSMVRRNRPDARFGRALDFGCGVGRLSLALAEVADEVLGIDISAPHLAFARARAEKVGRSNVRFEVISAIEALRGQGPFDFIVSLIVLQHNPPPVMAELLRLLLAALAPGGLAVFQIPTCLHGYSFTVADYFSNAQPPMEMNALPQPVVFDIIAEAGCVLLEVREDGAIGPRLGISHTFLVERR